MDLISLILFTYENNAIKSPTNIYDFTVDLDEFFPSWPLSVTLTLKVPSFKVKCVICI